MFQRRQQQLLKKVYATLWTSVSKNK